MSEPQPGILAPVPDHARYLEFASAPGRDPKPCLKALNELYHPDDAVVGFGHGLVSGLRGTPLNGLRAFPPMSGPHCEVPSTQHAVWVWLFGQDPGEVAGLARDYEQALGAAFVRTAAVNAFKFREGRDLSGYEDGTENPEGDDAMAAAIAADGELAGSSYVAVQQWAHDLRHFETYEQAERDNMIGRRLSDNEELDDAPMSAHVKRTAQESFDPEAFVVRRSMPWSDGEGEGLMFAAFGHSLDAFEAQMTRMAGLEDEITDALFRFSRPLTGGYYWCPPLKGRKLALAAIER